MVKEVHAVHILCKTEKKAVEVQEKLATGQESFAEIGPQVLTMPFRKKRWGPGLVWQGQNGPGV
jgi:hypothetical protein